MKKLSILPFLFTVVQIFAQSKENERFAFGFFIGLESQVMGVQPVNQRPEGLVAGSGQAGYGISLGAFARKPIRRWLQFQPQLALSYLENQVRFKPDGPVQYRFLDAEIPLHFVVSDWRRSALPLRGCVIFGGRMGWNFAQNRSNFLKISAERFALDLGLGAEIKLKKWCIQPAMVYSHGLNDLHFLENAKYDAVVGRVVRDKLSLRILMWKPRK